MEQPSKNEITAQRGSGPNPRTERMSLAAYLAAGVGLAGIASTADAAIVNINITDTRGDGNTTTDDNISGVNGGVGIGSTKTILNWLGAGVSASHLWLHNQDTIGNYFYHGIGAANGMEIALSGNSNASPRNFAAGATVDSTALWSQNAWQTVFEYYYNGGRTVSPHFTAGSYMGFRAFNGSGYLYGWLEVTWDSTGAGQWQILSGAYESTINTAIAAGQGAASVPAPSPASLLALIVGGAALRRWRSERRQQQLLEQTAA